MPKNRLSKITTKTGDQGQTGLGSGRRLSKQHIRIAVIGDVDELNSAVGCVVAAIDMTAPSDVVRDALLTIQHQLFNVGGELAMDGEMVLVTSADTLYLENISEQLNNQLQPLQEFILPVGNMAVAQCHLARSIARRAERHVVELAQQETIAGELLQYLNRLSDCLFIMARSLAKASATGEIYWQSERLSKLKQEED